MEIIKEIWQLKWWEIFIIASIDDIFFMVKAWFLWVGLIGIGVIGIVIKGILNK